MAFWNYVIYPKSDFALLDFNSSVTTNATLNPIYVTVEDDDTRFNQFGGDTGLKQVVTNSSDPSLIGLNIFSEVYGSMDVLYDDSSGLALTINEISIGGNTDYILVNYDGVNSTLSPSTTYNETSIRSDTSWDHSGTLLPCFTSGTLIAVPDGAAPVERLSPGDDVLTAEDRTVTIRWIGRRDVTAAELAADSRLLPVRIEAGSMGFGLPRRDLLVSRQHRMLMRSPIAERMYGSAEVLIPAVRLVGLPGIDVATDIVTVSYLHILCDRQEVLLAEGCPTESLYLGGALNDAATVEALDLSPELPVGGFATTPARTFAEGKRATKLVARHFRNRKPPLALPLARQAATEAA